MDIVEHSTDKLILGCRRSGQDQEDKQCVHSRRLCTAHKMDKQQHKVCCSPIWIEVGQDESVAQPPQGVCRVDVCRARVAWGMDVVTG